MKPAVVIPVLDEAAELPALLDHLAQLRGEWEVIVVDGGSRDASVALARAHPRADVVVEGGGGRAAQLNAGAKASRGDPLVFLHADSRLPAGAHAALAGASPEIAGGNFTLRFAGGDWFSRLLGVVYAAQRRRGYYYGDSTVWVRRATFAALGGFRPLAIMDDYDFVRRLERSGPTVALPGPALTSARRWQAMGIRRTLLSWVLIRWLFIAGVPAERLARMYRRVR